MHLTELESYLRQLPERGGADLLLCAGRPAFSRVAHELRALPGQPVLEDAGLRTLMQELLGAEQWQLFRARRSLTFASTLPSGLRVRGVCTESSAGVSCTLRVLPPQLLAKVASALPPALAKLTTSEPGLVLVAGPVGSGKTTLLSALLRARNDEQVRHIVTVEDPVEFLHENRKSVVSQRQVGAHCASFAAGIDAALGLDPDLLVVDGLDTPEAQRAALRAATSGVLVLASLRASGAARSIEQLLAAFPPHQRSSASNDLADCLQAIVSQELLPTRDGGLLPVQEILLRTPNLASVLRDGKTGMIGAIIEAGRPIGMQSLDAALLELAKQSVISGREAYARAADKKAFAQWAGERG
ncbi:MAG TPA: ATPase, T2SS/T4P/T4SS family [Polyangiales bacterium]